MKTNVIKTMAIIATLMFCGLPQNAFSQENKVKKVKFLGHKYEGQVNKDKIPEGDGTMYIGSLVIKGKFDETTVRDAIVKKGYETVIDATFSGTAKYDETDNITLEKGGMMSCSYSKKKRDYNTPRVGRVFMELKEDKIVNNQSFDPDKIVITYDVDYSKKIDKVFNPPIVKKEITILPSMHDYGTGKEMAFIDDTQEIKLDALKGYKDDQGRIWNWNEVGNGLEYRYNFRVTYPNGSFFKESYYRGTANRDWVINYPDGKKLIYESKGVGGFSLDSVVYLRVWKGNEETFAKFVGLNSLPKGHLDNDRVWLKGANLSSEEIGERIKKTINELVDNGERLTEVYDVDNETFRGKMDNGNYITQEVIDANRAAADAKTKKELQAKLAPFIKRFGFNPDGKGAKQLITYGRSLSLLTEWYYFRKDHKLSYYFFNLHEDLGSEKCYGIYNAKDYFSTSGTRQGYIWVKGDKITSVTWK